MKSLVKLFLEGVSSVKVKKTARRNLVSCHTGLVKILIAKNKVLVQKFEVV